MVATVLLAASLGTVSVTNLAGYAITGELTAVTNGHFTISGRTLPLKILPKGEQRRLRILASGDMRTPAERRRDRMVANDLKRLDALVEAGKVKREDAERMRAAIRAAGAAKRPTEPGQ